VSESRVTWATSVPILVFLGLTVLDLGPMYATDRRQTDVRQTNVRQHRRFMPRLLGAVHNNTELSYVIIELSKRRFLPAPRISVQSHVAGFQLPRKVHSRNGKVPEPSKNELNQN